MKDLYAIRNKETGALVWKSPDTLWAYQHEIEVLKGVDLTQYDYVPLRIEPDSSCPCCRYDGTINSFRRIVDLKNVRFCWECGRSLE